MNFLAHLYLSGKDEEIMIGNFIADAVKGNVINSFSSGIRNGIIQHREIDRFTDQHPVFRQSCARLTPKYHKYSGVIVDLYYDHFLSLHWNKYSMDDIHEFVSKVYSLLIQQFNILPPRSKRILPFIVSQNWLVGYANLDVLQRVFEGMARRTKFDSGMENAVSDLKLDYHAYEQEFHSFFPEIIKHMDEFRKKEIFPDGI